MKQIIYLGGKKAREYDGVDEPKQYGLYEKFVIRENAYHAHISTLSVVDVIGDCDWKKGEVKTEGVDYETGLQLKRYAAEEWFYSTPDVFDTYPLAKRRTVIVPIPKKQEGELQSDLWRALVCSVQIAAKEADKIDWNNDEEKELFIWEQIANQFTITRKS